VAVASSLVGGLCELAADAVDGDFFFFFFRFDASSAALLVRFTDDGVSPAAGTNVCQS